jgi:tetratricopeptide (TPR) repeat protein
MDNTDKKHPSPAAESGEPAPAKPPRSEMKQLSDEQLLAKLSSAGIELDQESLGRLSEQNLGARPVTKCLMDSATFKGQSGPSQIREIETCVAQLWQRWFPDKPSFERLDDRMQAGYALLQQKFDAVAVCEIWLDAWGDFLSLLDKSGSKSIDEFDEQFKGTEWVFNWLQEFEQELWNAGITQPRYFRERVRICEEHLRRFPSDHKAAIENRRRYLAESYFELGDTAKTEALYREWLAADPQCGWGWIGWARCYLFAREPMKDLHRAEQLLLEGLSVAQVRDADQIAEDLVTLYEQQGRSKEARQMRRRVQPSHAVTRGPPKVGRNDPCSCGSGKKFKKCCGSTSSGA